MLFLGSPLNAQVLVTKVFLPSLCWNSNATPLIDLHLFYSILKHREQLVTSHDLAWKNHNSTLSQGLCRDLHTDFRLRHTPPTPLPQHPHCSTTSSLVIANSSCANSSCCSSQDSNLCLLSSECFIWFYFSTPQLGNCP